MLETYKLMDELQRRKDEIGPEKHRAYLAQKYFPTEDEEDEDREGNIENMEELIKDDNSESVYESAQNSNN